MILLLFSIAFFYSMKIRMKNDTKKEERKRKTDKKKRLRKKPFF